MSCSSSTPSTAGCLSSRLTSFMTPDFAAVKEAREQHQVHLRSQRRIDAAITRRRAAPTGLTVKLREMLSSDDLAGRLEALETLKAALTDDTDKVLDAGVVSMLAHIMATESSEVAHNAVWCLAILSSQRLTERQLEPFFQALPTLVAIISPARVPTAYLAMWAVANLATLSEAYRHAAFHAGALAAVMGVLERSPNLDVRAVTWTLTHLVTHEECMQWPFEEGWVRALMALLERDEDDDAWGDVLMVLSVVTEAHPQLTTVIDTQCTRRLLKLLENRQDEIRFFSLKVIENITKGPTAHCKQLIALGVFESLAELLSAPSKELHSEVLWVLSNLCAAPSRQTVNKLISLKVFPRVMRLIREKPSHSLPGLWMLYNILIENSWLVMDHLVNSGAVECLFSVLRNSGADATAVALAVLLHLLEISTEASLDLGRNLAVEEIQEKRLTEELETLALCENAQIAKQATMVLERYFDRTRECAHMGVIDAVQGRFVF